VGLKTRFGGFGILFWVFCLGILAGEARLLIVIYGGGRSTAKLGMGLFGMVLFCDCWGGDLICDGCKAW
jgi:hypothetical protein